MGRARGYPLTEALALRRWLPLALAQLALMKWLPLALGWGHLILPLVGAATGASGLAGLRAHTVLEIDTLGRCELSNHSLSLCHHAHTLHQLISQLCNLPPDSNHVIISQPFGRGRWWVGGVTSYGCGC